MLKFVMRNVSRYWYQPSLSIFSMCLLPFSLLFALIITIRRYLYRLGWFPIYRFSVPVIVVGNIAVGGTGKTPLVIALANILKEKGYQPGIVSRGYGGKKHHTPYWIKAEDKPSDVGDEPILLLQATNCPVVVCVDRVKAVTHLLHHSSCNIIISDDGLQHYQLGRDIEIAVVDGVRRYGNGWLLPAGPLREPVSRLSQVDFVMVNGGNTSDPYYFTLEANQIVSLVTSKAMKLTDFPKQAIHAVAGIGRPERFFEQLEQLGFKVQKHAFPDHYAFQAKDLDYADNLPIMMTEKDAVKCKAFASDRYYALQVNAKINQAFHDKLIELMTR